MSRYLTLVLLCNVLAQAACSFTKDLEQHRSELLAAVGPEVPLAEKRDAVGFSTVRMMHEAVDRLNPKKGVKYVEAYAKTNGVLLDSLVAQITRAQNKMTTREQVAFGLSAATRPYAREAIALIPRFVKKYEQVRAVNRITGNLKDAVLGRLGDQLGGFLGDVETSGGTAPHVPLEVQGEREAERDPG